MDKKEAILQRIKKLIEHAESAKSMGSTSEAESFMMKATELCTEYNISMIEAMATEIKQGNEFKNWGYSETISYYDKHQGNEWKKSLLSVITDYNFTSFVFWKKTMRLQVYGSMENVDMTVWLYNFMSIGLYNLAQQKYKEILTEKRKRNKAEADKFCKVEAYEFKRDFLLGAIDGIAVKLAKQRADNYKGAYDIIKVNDDALSTFVEQKFPRIHKKKPSKVKYVETGEGYNHGYEAGKNFNINKPLNTNQDVQKLRLT